MAPEPQRIEVRIARDGTISAETHGIKGRACVPYIAMLEDLLEARAVDSAYTAEYEQTVAITPAQQEQRGADLEAGS
jgi:hypothetical protein